MKKFSILQAPYMTFFSMAFYRDVARHWKGAGVGYMLLLVALLFVPMSIRMQMEISDYVKNQSPALTNQIPDITITDGKAYADAQQPYTITEPQSGEVLAVIDTTGKITNLEDAGARILMTENELIYQKSDFENRSMKFKDIKHFSLDKQGVQGWFELARKFAVPFLYCFVVFFIYLFRIIQMLLYAVVGLLFASMCKVDLSYGALMRLSAMALTPTLIVNMLTGLVRIQIPFHGLLNLVAALVILYVAIKAISTQEIDEDLEQDVDGDNPLNAFDVQP